MKKNKKTQNCTAFFFLPKWLYSSSHTSFLGSEEQVHCNNARKIGVILMVKKKAVEPSDSHVREAYLAEGKERHTTQTPTIVSTTSIPNQPIAPIAVPNLSPVGHSYPKNDLRIIEGINGKIMLQLEKLGISNIEDLAKASAENMAKDLQVDLSTARKWISAAKKLE